MRNLGLLSICLLLTACVSGGGVSPANKASLIAEVGLSVEQLRLELANVPGARVAAGEPLVVSFPVGTLFAAASVLPMPGGTAPLDALASLVKRSELNWRIKLRAATGEGNSYDSELAGTRAQIMKVYFKNSGVNLDKIAITAVAEPGAPLELQPIQ